MFVGKQRLRAVVTVLMMVVIIAACGRPAPAPVVNPPGPTCLDAAPIRAADYQRAFDTRTNDWAGGDGAFDVALPDGRVLWLFGDTFSGTVNGRTLRPGYRIPRNSFQVQTGRCFAPELGGTLTRRTSRIADPAADEWYWPIAGSVSGNEVRVWMYHLRRVDGLPGWDWTVLGLRVASLRLPDLVVTSVSDDPHAAGTPLYGESVVTSGATVHLYGGGAGGQYLARASVAQAATGPYEYWAGGSTWSPDPGAAVGLQLPGATRFASLSFVAYGSGYLASGRLFGILSTAVHAWYSPTPQGPWHPLGQIGETALDPGQFAYGGRVAAGLPGTPPMVVSSVNAMDAATTDLLRYGARFTEPTGLADPATLAAQYPAGP
jgi:Domain of unknown function (DUF5005)